MSKQVTPPDEIKLIREAIEAIKKKLAPLGETHDLAKELKLQLFYLNTPAASSKPVTLEALLAQFSDEKISDAIRQSSSPNRISLAHGCLFTVSSSEKFEKEKWNNGPFSDSAKQRLREARTDICTKMEKDTLFPPRPSNYPDIQNEILRVLTDLEAKNVGLSFRTHRAIMALTPAGNFGTVSFGNNGNDAAFQRIVDWINEDLRSSQQQPKR